MKAEQDRLAAQRRAAALKAQREAEAAAKKAKQEKDAAALAAIGKVQQINDEIAVTLKNDILFDYGKATLSKNAKQTFKSFGKGALSVLPTVAFVLLASSVKYILVVA